MNIAKYFVISCLCLFSLNSVFAERPVGVERKSSAGFRTADACVPPSASAELNINNVRCLLHNGGDMWWDLVSNPRYEIPKGGGRHSLFASSLWIGGVDAAGQMRVAAQTYRQSGYDFWAGPLTPDQASTDDATCGRWNKMVKITKSEIDAFRADYADNNLIDKPELYPNVYLWPAGGKQSPDANYDYKKYLDADGNVVEADAKNENGGNKIFLAPFKDQDGDPLSYNPGGGDYPLIKGDQAIFWVINDKGNVHTETNAQPIGVEIHMMAFGFAAANAINNMTFYDQTVINRSSLTLEDTYLGQWVDADLGNYSDDYVGCDKPRGLGFCYNGDDNDEGASGYGLHPPAVGVDFFQGPLANFRDGIDNDRDGVADPYIITDPVAHDTSWLPEHIIMSKFVYYNNDWSLTGNPEAAVHYYNYLKGIWKDGTQMVANSKNGYAPTAAGEPTDFMFDGDVCQSIGWTETSAGNKAADRRFLQSAGPFTLQPGAVNQVVTGVVWARGASNTGSVCELQQADDIAQALFDANFRLLEGPDAPNVSKGEYNQQIILRWGYDGLENTSNNFNEKYIQSDPILKKARAKDSLFTFQGYMIMQLADSTVGLSELFDNTKARLVAQCDIQDNVSTIVNRTVTSVGGQGVVTDQVMVQGLNKGITHSAKITEDLFVTDADRKLRNYTPYYYAIIAYAYNDTASDGRLFVPGNGNFKRVKATPHPVDMQNGGTDLNGIGYGQGLPITQINGIANGGNFVQMTDETENRIFASPTGKVDVIDYKEGRAPISVKVVDPKSVTGSDYKVKVYGAGFKTFLKFYDTDIEDPKNVATIDGMKVIDARYSSTINKGTGTDSVVWEFLVINTTNLIKQENVYIDVNSRDGYATDYIMKDWELYQGSTATPVYTSSYRLRNKIGMGAKPSPMSGVEQVIEGHGISVAVKDVPYIDSTLESGGVIGDTTMFGDPTKSWLSGLVDNDDILGGFWNWIMGGSYKKSPAPIRYESAASNYYIYDKYERYEKLIAGRWSPFCITKPFDSDKSDVALGIPLYNGLNTPTSKTGIGLTEVTDLRKISDVDIVFTSDKSKWTRCPVVETSPSPGLGSGAYPLCAKWADNVNKEGQSEGKKAITLGNSGNTHGMGWFPGYAINVNTGQRVALFFGESTWDKNNNGADMIFNPTADYGVNLDRAGGRHYVYVLNRPYAENDTLWRTLMNDSTASASINTDIWFVKTNPLDVKDTLESHFIGDVYKHVAWAGIPMLDYGYDFKKPEEMPTDVRLQLRVNRPYEKRAGEELNDFVGQFSFSTKDYAVKKEQNNVAKSALDMIRVVPNPYYGYSDYEDGQLDNKVKITNLPAKCTISIFSLNGYLLKTYNKDSDEVEQIWDLKNQNGVPVASGVYIIHINAPGIGEKVVKLMTIMRQTDLNSY